MTATSAEFEKATDFQFREEDVERPRALVGRWAPSAAREHLTTATHDAMRNFARGYGDDNPLFNSEDYGNPDRCLDRVGRDTSPMPVWDRRDPSGSDRRAGRGK